MYIMKKTFAAFHWQELRQFNTKSSPQRWQLTLLNELLDRKFVVNNNDDAVVTIKKFKRDDQGRFIGNVIELNEIML